MAAQRPQTAARAVALLNWLATAHRGGRGRSIMALVTQALDTAGRVSSSRPSGPAAVAVTLEVDVTALANDDPELAMDVLSTTGKLADEATRLVNAQLATMHHAAHGCGAPVGETALSSRAGDVSTVSISLRLTHLPLPLLSAPEVAQQIARSGSASTVLVSCVGVVTGMSGPADVVASQRFQCPACGMPTDVAPSETHLPCCNLPRADCAWLKEDLTGRVMAQTQQLWLAELSTATGRAEFGVSRPPLGVTLPDSLVGVCSLGEVVQVFGRASTAWAADMQSAAGSAGPLARSVRVQAVSMERLLPHSVWTCPAGQQQQPVLSQEQPLQQLWELLGDALGYQAPLDPHLAVSLLLSAAGAGSGGSTGSLSDAGGGGASRPPQVNLLVLHEAGAPATPRLLREAAALLHPTSVAMPVHNAQLCGPIVAAGSGGGSGSGDAPSSKAVFAGLLLTANSGIAAANLSIMPPKVRQQLLGALQQRDAAPAAKDLPAGVPQPPTSATVWASAAWDEVCPDGGRQPAHGSKAAASVLNGLGAATAFAAFDLCVGDNSIYEDDLWRLLDLQGASAQTQSQLHAQSQGAAAVLRRLVSASAGLQPPLLTQDAQAFLCHYFLMMRQSIECSSHMSKPHLLASLMRVATASARLHQRTSVQQCPDAALAVVLMEQTLANKLGESYRPLLDLPGDLAPGDTRTLDQQLQLLHAVMCRSFRQHGCAGGASSDGADNGAAGSSGGGSFAGVGACVDGAAVSSDADSGLRGVRGYGADRADSGVADFLQPDSQVEQ